MNVYVVLLLIVLGFMAWQFALWVTSPARKYGPPARRRDCPRAGSVVLGFVIGWLVGGWFVD